MAAPMENNVVSSGSTISEDKSVNAIIVATVTTGFERLACDECSEKLGVEATPRRGRIRFELPLSQLQKVHSLCGVDNLFVVVQEFENHQFIEEEEADLQSLSDLVTTIDWSTGIKYWQSYSKYAKSVPLTPEEISESDHATLPAFRVSCHRTGNKHSFQSPQAASRFGGSINDYFHWRVDLSNSDIDVLLNITDNDILVGIALTRESMHRRNIKHFGSTTLRATLAYMMLRLGEIQLGDVVCDPMCGCGAIPIEGVLNWPGSLHLCGDGNEYPCSHSLKNITAINETRKEQNRLPVSVDIVQWDVCQLPLKTNSIDVFVSDLPFGKRSGTRRRNWDLYHRGLVEMARVCKPETGRAVLLTHDKKCMMKTLSLCHNLWRSKRTIWINQGGLRAGVYLLHRAKAS
ncbi:tRNA (guanine(6)-N(2))-methyltransferase THUMP3-like [Saccoglossus kowalevskii]|uniref:THUMP domain-containing protein 3-like n=1 Tax=Saccoglossus kowalevskii TaxID=10224 RepID=A0ABM0MU51_SACKO|nr:PREDICTED: THUMP domain-containing protein 3-like [Saccoglossus kowalevskii]